MVEKLKRPLVAILLMALSISSCSPAVVTGDALEGEISISGAFAIYPIMTRWAEDFQRINPGVRFSIASGGAGKGMEDILANKVDIAMISREITTIEENQGAYPLAIAKDAVFVLININNPAANVLLSQGITLEMLKKIFITGQVITWGEVIDDPAIGDEIHVYTRSDICGAAATWSLFLGGTQADLLGQGKFGDPGMLQALQTDPLGIGYNNLIYAYGLGDVPPTGTTILPIDINLNGKADQEEILDTRQKADTAVASGLYPAPPSRTLYLVTNGKPAGVVAAFLKWVLTDGQAYVESTGYVHLPDEQISASLGKIK